MAQVTPARKERKRYVVYHPRDDSAVLTRYKELFGAVGLAHAGIQAVDGNDQKGILRISHTHTDELKAALVASKKHSLITTGTLKTARKALG